MSSLSIAYWVIVLIIAVLVFGAKRLCSVGEDLSGAVYGSKKDLNEGTGGQSAKKGEVIEHKRGEEDRT